MPIAWASNASGNTINHISLKTGNGHYFVAENNGGSAVNANRTASGPWEQFKLIDANGGNLVSGDTVYIQTSNGFYFRAVNAGGSDLDATATAQNIWETYIILKPSDPNPSFIRNHDKVAFKSYNGHYMQAFDNGGSGANVEATQIGPWETFEIQMFGETEITSPYGNNCLTKIDSPNNDVRAKSCGQNNQNWALNTNQSIQLVSSDLCLDRTGSDVLVVMCNGTASQQWGHQNGEILTTDSTPLCLEADNDNGVHNMNVTVTTCTHNLDQKWFVMY